MNNITLHDLMAQDVDVWLSKNKTFGFNLEIEDSEGTILVDEQGIHPCSVESLADFCRRYLAFYDRAIQGAN